MTCTKEISLVSIVCVIIFSLKVTHDNCENIQNAITAEYSDAEFSELEIREETFTSEDEQYKYMERFNIGYDRERKEITFPVRDIEGKCVFIAERSVKRKFLRLPKGMDKSVYQAYKFSTGWYRTAYITESFLNCLTC